VNIHPNPEGLMENSGGRGLPEKLPAGERVLWQGSPSWRVLFRHAFHGRFLAAYFAVIVTWCTLTNIWDGEAAGAVALSFLKLGGLSLVPIALIALYSWGIERSTIYTITSRRVVISVGIAVPMTINLPFARIESAGLKHYAGGAGDIPLALLPTERMAYLLVWPHARPWRMARAEPMLRCISDVQSAAAVLARALAAHSSIPISYTVAEPSRQGVSAGLQGQAAHAA
jgi:hypothetical protein